MMRRAFIAALAVALLAPLAGAEEALPPDYEPLQRFPAAELRIETAGGAHRFRVWIARSPQQRAQGLMYVRTLDADRGMLFVFPAPLLASFWMKNTYVPLDMLFARADGRIQNIAANTRPLTTDPYSATGPVRLVLELPGGTCARLGIKSGDRLVLPPGALRGAH
jgi:uncharacterized membrane protein (UPF0127 family)